MFLRLLYESGIWGCGTYDDSVDWHRCCAQKQRARVVDDRRTIRPTWLPWWGITPRRSSTGGSRTAGQGLLQQLRTTLAPLHRERWWSCAQPSLIFVKDLVPGAG